MNLNKVIALVLAWQMAFSPIAFAQSSSLADAIGTAISVAQQVGEAANQRNAQQQAMLMQQSLMAQMNPRNCAGRQCTSPIFPECNILVTRTNVVEPAACTSSGAPSVNQDPATQSTRLYQAMAYKEHYNQTENIYATFLTEGNQQSNEGMTCLNNQAAALENRLKAREDEIDNLIAKMQVAHDDFKQRLAAARAVEQVEEGQAELTGKPQTGLDRVMARDSQRFAKSFQDAACQTVMGADGINALARNGLVSIEARMTEIANKKTATGRGNFNAMEFNSATAGALEADIRRVADLNSRGVASNVASWLNRPSTPSNSSTYGLDGANGPLSSIVGEIHQEAKIENETLNQQVAEFLDNSPSSQSLAQALNGTSEEAFTRAITNFEISTTNTCLNNSPNIAGLLNNSIRMENPEASKFANDNANNAYLEFIRTTLGNNNLTIEQKMEAIRSFEGQGINNTYVMRLQRTMTVPNGNGSAISIDPTQRLTPAAFINYHVQNCRAQFDSNPISNGATGRQIVERARAARVKITQFRNNLSNKVRNTIVDRLVNCADGLQATASGVATCSERNLSSSTPGFCVRNAISCATNMRSCLNTAKTEVQRVTTKRDADVRTYKVALTTHNNAMQAMYREVTRILSLEGLAIQNSQLRQGLVLPADVQMVPDFKDSSKNFIRGLEALEMEDPDAYLKLTKTNLQRLKDRLKTQREEIMNGDSERQSQSELAQGVLGHIRQVASNMEAEKQRAAGYRDQCNDVIERFNRDFQRQQEAIARAQQERDQGMQNACASYNALRSSPTCDIAEALDAPSNAAAVISQEALAVNAFRRHCENDVPQTAPQILGPELISRSRAVCADLTNRLPACATTSDRVHVFCQETPDGDGYARSELTESVIAETRLQNSGTINLLKEYADRLTTPPPGCTNLAENSTISQINACWRLVRSKFNSDDGMCSESKLQTSLTPLIRSTPSRNQDEAVWRRLTSSLGEQSSGMCAAQNSSSLPESLMDGLQSNPSGIPGASLEGFGR